MSYLAFSAVSRQSRNVLTIIFQSPEGCVLCEKDKSLSSAEADLILYSGFVGQAHRKDFLINVRRAFPAVHLAPENALIVSVIYVSVTSGFNIAHIALQTGVIAPKHLFIGLKRGVWIFILPIYKKFIIFANYTLSQQALLSKQ